MKRTLADAGVTDFMIVEYNDEVGGRVHHENFGSDAQGNPLVVEYGANWVQGLGTEGGPGTLKFTHCCTNMSLTWPREPHLDTGKLMMHAVSFKMLINHCR